ncbi:glutathione S-transferase [Dothidotthia symphoricarpi CBS 119687]|uniref:Glutathione S-transferase n=1 Tax=Dothidotthia symphoricarpi CBS 119687 TaxID=1392245 RepID=A0A6A6AMY1_9PLEO|nr:glutathione S-transferase [Dothidotthia symphoricarpi CBS 119687]KAF2131841.1 glutathione S-transferase [Dothidotthia symphoricarpi CBS 119687]
MPPITLWFLQASRCIRTAWLLEELGLEYNVKSTGRTPAGKAPDDFKRQSGNPLGKFPTIQDGDLTIGESGAITEYLCETYDKASKYIPKDLVTRTKVLQWIHASEATFALHGIAILYTRWNLPKDVPAGTLEAMEKGLSVNVQNDLNWLEDELSKSSGRFLCGDHVTAADVMMQFSAEFILARELGTQGKNWPKVEEWLQTCTNTEGYKRAVEKTGHKL